MLRWRIRPLGSEDNSRLQQRPAILLEEARRLGWLSDVF